MLNINFNVPTCRQVIGIELIFARIIICTFSTAPPYRISIPVVITARYIYVGLRVNKYWINEMRLNFQWCLPSKWIEITFAVDFASESFKLHHVTGDQKLHVTGRSEMLDLEILVTNQPTYTEWCFLGVLGVLFDSVKIEFVFA